MNEEIWPEMHNLKKRAAELEGTVTAHHKALKRLLNENSERLKGVTNLALGADTRSRQNRTLVGWALVLQAVGFGAVTLVLVNC